MGEVVDLFSRSRGRAPIHQNQERTAQQVTTDTSVAPTSSFDDIAKRNAENRERLRRERLEANQNVLKSYRIK